MADVRFAGEHFAVFERGFERNELIRRRKDSPPNRQDFTGHTHGVREVSSNMAQCGKEKIAEAVASQTDAGLEPILKQPA